MIGLQRPRWGAVRLRAIPPWVSIPRTTLERVVALALQEDLGSGDLTTAACVHPDALGRAEMLAREPLVLCGAEIVREVFRQVDPALAVIADREPIERNARDVTVRAMARQSPGGSVTTMRLPVASRPAVTLATSAAGSTACGPSLTRVARRRNSEASAISCFCASGGRP